MRTKCERGDSVYVGLNEVALRGPLSHFHSRQNLVQCLNDIRRVLPMCVKVSTDPLSLSVARRLRRGRVIIDASFLFVAHPLLLT